MHLPRGRDEKCGLTCEWLDRSHESCEQTANCGQLLLKKCGELSWFATACQWGTKISPTHQGLHRIYRSFLLDGVTSATSSELICREQVQSYFQELVGLEHAKVSQVVGNMKLSYSLFLSILLTGAAAQSDNCSVTTQYLTDPPYDNYFYSDCDVDAQVVITSPLPDSNLTVIGPRLIIAWPAGNSGIAAFFQPENGPNGTLAIELVNSTIGTPLAAYVQDSNSSSGSNSSDYPSVGVTGVLSFNASAVLTVSILGSVRTIRDFTEGPSLLVPVIQDAINVSQYNDTGAAISRLWLDNVTISTLTFVPWQNANTSIEFDAEGRNVTFGAGYYQFEAFFNYPQLQQLTPEEVLNNNSQDLIQQNPSETTSLSFLSYSEKLLAGAWRFLTYFGRDSMISALLLEPVLSTGNASAVEAVIGAVLERINRTGKLERALCMVNSNTIF